MLILFAVPRPFENHYAVIQRNALRSWCLLTPRPEIILLGSDYGTEEIAFEFGVRHIPNIDYSEFGTPLLDSMHRAVEQYTSNNLLCIVNADIILLDDFMDAVQSVSTRNKKWIMVGQRHNLDINRDLDFGPNWSREVKLEVESSGILGPRTGEDYIVFPKGYFLDIPPMVVGHS